MIRILITIISCVVNTHSALADPVFPNSVVSNDLEFIKTTDQDVFSCLGFVGTRRAEMPDKRNNQLFANGVFVFKAQYKDGTNVELWAHPDFETEAKALSSVEPVARAIGKLPTVMRSRLDHVVVHFGDETAFGEAEGNFFVIYSDNINIRLRNHDLEETVFHESVHATLDARYLRSRVWRNAQRADGKYVTNYAASNPGKEDMAESALFAWAILVHPGRLPSHIETVVKSIMPNRLEFFEDLFLEKTVFFRFTDERSC